ncbi:uncharacterized protein LOC105180043 isoform X2 [Sesamum indicum]|uniref:Uncharacterized protein LOC105180043 isoform X2 n=1 Tax=Sesamum indicum TaxID=4182 RepID=A0A8M8VFS0_SESIN|nr:uncharacterized protein LOC105180043 isoform X2 [Sesamum indicum]
MFHPATLSDLHENRDSNWYSDGLLQLRPNHHQESMDSGETSPPLWKTCSPSPQKSPSHPLLNHRSLSPDSRAQAIARGQWELMEMVKNMPESSYELTLKDLVEHRSIEAQAPENEHRRGVVKERQREIGRKYERNEMSLEKKGVFLNVVFPVSLESRKKNSRGKVSPKPEGLKGGGERDWWKKRFTGSSDSDSSRTSNGSSTGSSGGGRYVGGKDTES